jgi:hypothetical protein
MEILLTWNEIFFEYPLDYIMKQQVPSNLRFDFSLHGKKIY